MRWVPTSEGTGISLGPPTHTNVSKGVFFEVAYIGQASRLTTNGLRSQTP